MEILQIANKATFPPDGGSLAILSLARGYVKNNHQVYLLNMETPKHFNNPGLLEPEIKDKLLVHGVRVNTHLSMIKLGLNLLFSNKPYIAQRFISSKYTRALKKLISAKSFDIIQVEGLYMLQYIRIIKKNFSKKIIYRPHNIEHKIWERNAQETRSCF